MEPKKLQYLIERDQTITKANELIRNTRFSLSVIEQKIVLYLISQIKPTDQNMKLYSFNIREFCTVCGMSIPNGAAYTELKDIIKKLADKSVWIRLPDQKTDTLLRWIEKPYINEHSGTIKIRLDRDMMPFLLQLKKNFTQYQLIYTLALRSKYSIRFYELIKSLHFHKDEELTQAISLEDLRRALGAETYTRYPDFRVRVLKPAVEEINQYTDETIICEPVKVGRRVDEILITIKPKGMVEKMRVRDEIDKELGTDQQIMWDFVKDWKTSE